MVTMFATHESSNVKRKGKETNFLQFKHRNTFNFNETNLMTNETGHRSIIFYQMG